MGKSMLWEANRKETVSQHLFEARILLFRCLSRQQTERCLATALSSMMGSSWSWKSVKSSSQSFPRSVIARNHLWPDFIISKLSPTSLEQEPQPYVTVVGDGHLAGDDSFISLLITAIKPQSVERFVNQIKSWKKLYNVNIFLILYYKFN